MWPNQDKVQNRHPLLWFTHSDSIFFFPLVNSTKTLCDSVHKAQNQYFPAVVSSWLILSLYLPNTPKSFSSEHQLPRFIISLGGPSLRNITLPAPLIASRRWAFSYHPSSRVVSFPPWFRNHCHDFCESSSLPIFTVYQLCVDEV